MTHRRPEPTPTPFPALAALTPAEVRRRASSALVVFGTRGLAIMLIGLASNVVLARLLTPHDFGLAAIGLTFVSFVGLLSDGGLGGGLIRRARPPDISELRALLAMQLTVTVVLAAGIAAVATPLGEGGRVVALMVCSMPLVALQFPGKITLERDLRFRPLALVELSQVLAYQAVAIGLVLGGAGVWGLAIGTLARALVGATVTNLVSPVRVLRPSFSWARVRPLLAFGMRLQLISGTWLAREQGLNAAIAAIGGVATLGLFSLAKRLLEVPYLIVTSLGRISFPAMSQLLAAKEQPGRLIERALSVTVVGTGIMLVALAGSGPGLVPGVFGEQWRAAADVLPGACLGMFVAGSIAVGTQGFLFAVGDADAVLRATALSAFAVFGVTLPLLPSLGTWAIGLGMLVSSLTEATILARATRGHTPVRFASILVLPTLLAVPSAAAGWWVSVNAGEDLPAGLGGAATAVSCFLAGLMLFRRGQLSAAYQVARGAIANSRRRRPAATSE
jgi:O-antigen/teichoic acid export membrane protein